MKSLLERVNFMGSGRRLASGEFPLAVIHLETTGR
jgi:hypothetical protein